MCSFPASIFNTGKNLFVKVSFQSQQERHRFSRKAQLKIFKITLRLRDPHVFTRLLQQNLKVFISLTLKQFSENRKPFL